MDERTQLQPALRQRALQGFHRTPDGSHKHYAGTYARRACAKRIVEGKLCGERFGECVVAVRADRPQRAERGKACETLRRVAQRIIRREPCAFEPERLPV